jgi:hypothetical protein
VLGKRRGAPRRLVGALFFDLLDHLEKDDRQEPHTITREYTQGRRMQGILQGCRRFQSGARTQFKKKTTEKL